MVKSNSQLTPEKPNIILVIIDHCNHVLYLGQGPNTRAWQAIDVPTAAVSCLTPSGLISDCKHIRIRAYVLINLDP